jgi:hypothetical protein
MPLHSEWRQEKDRAVHLLFFMAHYNPRQLLGETSPDHLTWRLLRLHKFRVVGPLEEKLQ